MNITLDNFRTLANGTENLGFVKLTNENGQLGICKANNFKHRVWKNCTSEADSADNLRVRQELVKAFTDAGAGTGFVRDLRARLGLNNAGTTAAILTRNELREIFVSYDRDVRHSKTMGKAFDEMAATYIPDSNQRAMLGEQLRLLRGAFVDARMAAQTIGETKEVVLHFTHALQDMCATFPTGSQAAPSQPVQPQPVQPQSVPEHEDPIQQVRNDIEQQNQHCARLEKFAQISQDTNEIAEKDINKIFVNIRELPGFSYEQRRVVFDVIMNRVNQLRSELTANVRKQMVDRDEIDGQQASYRLKKGWVTIDQAVRTVLTSLTCQGVDEAHGEGELFKELIRTKLQAALDEQAF